MISDFPVRGQPASSLPPLSTVERALEQTSVCCAEGVTATLWCRYAQRKLNGVRQAPCSLHPEQCLLSQKLTVHDCITV